MKDNNVRKFIKLVKEVLKTRYGGKAEKDTIFLHKIFKSKKISYKPKIKYLGKMYSVARTLNPELSEEDWENLFDDNINKYKDYEKKVVNTKDKLKDFLNELLEFLETKEIKIEGKYKKLGSKKKKNSVVSALSKYGYYHTEANFPIYDTYAEKYIKLLFEKLYTKKQKEELANQTKHKDKYWRHFFRYGKIIECLNSKKIKKFKIKKHLYTLISGVDSFVWMYGIMKSAMKDPIRINKKETLCYSQTCGDVTGFVSWYKNAKIFLRDKDKKRV